MEVKRIQSGQPVSQIGTEKAQDQRHRRELYKTSAFDTAGSRQDLSALNPEKAKAQAETVDAINDQQPRSLSYRLPNGTLLEIPCLCGAERKSVDRIYERLQAEQRDELVTVARRLSKGCLEAAAQGPEALQSASAALKQDASAVETLVAIAEDEGYDVASKGMLVGIEAMEQNISDVFKFMEQKQATVDGSRSELVELRQMLGDWPDDGSKQTFTYHELVNNPDGSISAVEHKDAELTKEQAQDLVDSLDSTVESALSLSAMEQSRVQVMVNQYQQAVTAVSNIMKDVLDAKEFLNNLRA